MQTYYNELFLSFIEEDKRQNAPSILLYWGYREHFSIRKTLESKSNVYYIRLSFYHHEVNSTLPALTHEVGHLLLKNLDILKDDSIGFFYYHTN